MCYNIGGGNLRILSGRIRCGLRFVVIEDPESASIYGIYLM